MNDQERNQPQPVNAHQQPGQMSTADIAAASSRPATPDSTQGPERRPAPEQPQRPTRAATGSPTSLLPGNDVQDLRSQWNDIQAGFVDRPRESVQGADALVATVMQRLAETFADERSNLEKQWSRGDDVSTEDLRVALQRYRSFFDRLLSL